MFWYYVMMNDGYDEEWVDLFSNEETANAACADYQQEEPGCTFYIQRVYEGTKEIPRHLYIDLDDILHELNKEKRI